VTAAVTIPVAAQRPGVRQRHPFGFLGAAFVAGAALAGAESFMVEHFPALKRRLR
jgi:hypothetical protein